jgi:DNA mismatch repair ATPase MutL
MKTIQSSGQNLVNPLSIKFSSALEATISDYLPLIRKYGFEIEIKEDGGLNSLYLTRVPILKNLTLG